jgi:GH24 family phage-related lysozyme (muramidase)
VGELAPPVRVLLPTPRSGPVTRLPPVARGLGWTRPGPVREVERRLGFRYPDTEFRHNTALAVRRFEIRHHWRHASVVVTRAVWLTLRAKPVARRHAAALGLVASVSNWTGSPGFVRRVKINLNWFDRAYGGILLRANGQLTSGQPLKVDGTLSPRLKAAVKQAKYLLGYPDARIAWASGVDDTFIGRLHHPSCCGMPSLWVKRGIGRRRAVSIQHTSPAGVAFIAGFEGFEPVPAPDPVGYCTVGYGHLIRYSGCTSADMRNWGRMSEKQGRLLLGRDLARNYEPDVRRGVHVTLTARRFDAFVSFDYNLGPGALRELLPQINNRNWTGVGDHMLAYVHAGGQVLPGLVRRRRAERAMVVGG